MITIQKFSHFHHLSMNLSTYFYALKFFIIETNNNFYLISIGQHEIKALNLKQINCVYVWEVKYDVLIDRYEISLKLFIKNLL